MYTYIKPAPQNQLENFEKLTDSELFQRAQEYGLRAKQWLRKFEGLLPEIMRRKLYKRRGFASIHEFAAKLGGMSHEKTDRILRLARTLENKPALKNIFETGAASYSKIKTVAYIATPKTDVEWAEKVIAMPKSALELCVAAVREKTIVPGDNFKPVKILSVKISAELEYDLRLVKQKLEKQGSETLGFAEVLQELVKVYNNQKQLQKPQRIIQLCPKCIKEKANDMAQYGLVTRHIPQEVQNLVTARQKGACAFPGCNRPPEIFHHTRRFSIQQNHDPDYLVHLCTPHERAAHAGLIENEEQTPCNWSLKEKANLGASKGRIDVKVNSYRREQILEIC
ncbi:hypothetical protein HYW83_05345 [Candidatus Peregrinibacteria bacterium]|nr:hypothetical protein [Candidatus Peregrinibacteria bacterium]